MPVPIGLENTIVQRTFKIVSETTSGSPHMVSSAIVQVNQGGALRRQHLGSPVRLDRVHRSGGCEELAGAELGGVDTGSRGELVVGADLDDPTPVEHGDAVG